LACDGDQRADGLSKGHAKTLGPHVSVGASSVDLPRNRPSFSTVKL
jgi:hypothetical protein